MNHFELVLFTGNANKKLAKEISEFLKVEVSKCEIKQFADGETYVHIEENVRGRDVFIIQPTCKPVNENLMELSIMIDAAKRASAKRVTAVMPYYGYARQDRKALPREPITSKLVANLITAAGADRVLTVDLHSGQIQGFFDIPLDHLYALPLLAEYFKDKKLKNMVTVSPDAGGAKKARRLAKILQTPLAIIDKRRPMHNEVEVTHLIGDVKGKSAILIDDMIDTGGTISAAANAVMDMGAKEVYICATHGLLSGPAVDRLKKSKAKEVILTNTVPIEKEKMMPKMKILSVAKLVGEAIRRIHENESVSYLAEDIAG